MPPTLILASSSPRRRELLSSLGIPFTIIKPDIDETQHPGEPPLDYVRRLSREKAAAIASRLEGQSPSLRSGEGFREGIILAADTVVILDADTLGVDEHGHILGKPANPDEARDMLRRLRGRTHQVCTAITLHLASPDMSANRDRSASLSPSLQSGEGFREGRWANALTRVTCTGVTMRDYTDAEIEAYIDTGDPFDKAGSYAIQHPVFQPVAHISGCYTNVVGLPVCTLRDMLAEIGWAGVEAAGECDCSELFPRP